MSYQYSLLYPDIKHQVYHGDCLVHLPRLQDSSIDLIIIDPPYGTGKKRTFRNGSYDDKFSDSQAYKIWLKPILKQCYRVLSNSGSLFLFIDEHEKLTVWSLLNDIFGRSNMINEIVWCYDWGFREKNRWTPKHDTIFWFAKDRNNYVFNRESSDRIAKRSPNLFEDGSVDKLPTDVWWQTIVTASSNESTGYPTQKPEKLIERIVTVHSNESDTILDCFAGSGTTGIVAAKFDRNSILMDKNLESIQIIKQRLKGYNFKQIV